MSEGDKTIIQECDHKTGRQLYEIDGTEVWMCDWGCGRVTIEPQGVEVTDMYKELDALKQSTEKNA